MKNKDNEIVKAIAIVVNFTQRWIRHKRDAIKEYKLTYYDKKKLNSLEIATKILSEFYYKITHEGESHDKTRRSNKK